MSGPVSLALASALLASFTCMAQSPVPGSCYTDKDCMFYSKDNSGLITGEVVGTCVPRSESLSMCKCLPAYTGKNCEFSKSPRHNTNCYPNPCTEMARCSERCPVAATTGFMCNGVQGEGKDYYAPFKHADYMGSEWNTYDEVLDVDNHIQSFHSTTGYDVNYDQLHRGPHKVGGICDFNTGKCSCHPTYFGATCEMRTCPLGVGHGQLTASTCSGQGECITERAGQESVCKCQGNFFGLDCSLRHCPNSTRGFQCDNHGTCDHPTGFCVCDQDRYGPSCEYKTCPVVGGRVCNGQGTCHTSTAEATIGTKSWSNITDSQGKKHVDYDGSQQCQNTPDIRLPDGSSGSNCRPKTGQKDGVCSCRWPYYGPDCTLKLCPNSTSVGSGTGFECDGPNSGSCNRTTGFCMCEAGSFGKDCHRKLCPYSSNNTQRVERECNGEGTCDREWGRCKCHNKRFYGPKCDKMRCPSFPDEVTSDHTSGSVELSGFEEGYTQWANECSGPAHGQCNTLTGTCVCNAGFTGKVCRHADGPVTSFPATPQQPGVPYQTNPYSGLTIPQDTVAPATVSAPVLYPEGVR